jgi:hypothetical protein
MTLMVCPSQDRTRMELRIERGIESATMSVERQLPMNIRTAAPASTAAMAISTTTSPIDALTNSEASLSGVMVTPWGRALSNAGSLALTPLTTSSVEAPPSFRMVRRTACCPFTRTTFC